MCRNTSTFLHWTSKHIVHVIKKHFLNDGISTGEDGDTGSHPKHALTFRMILGILQFIQDYAEQHAIFLPGHVPIYEGQYQTFTIVCHQEGISKVRKINISDFLTKYIVKTFIQTS